MMRRIVLLLLFTIVGVVNNIAQQRVVSVELFIIHILIQVLSNSIRDKIILGF